MFDDNNPIDVHSALIRLALRHAMVEYAIECRAVGKDSPRGLRFSVWLVADLGDE